MPECGFDQFRLNPADPSGFNAAFSSSGRFLHSRMRFHLFPSAWFLVASALLSSAATAADPVGVLPTGRDGHVLNLDFETGDLRDWTATGTAFKGQPVRGDRVKARRADMSSHHTGEFWIGGFETGGDDAKGTLTSAPFKITQPWASFRFAAGASPETRIELVDVADGTVFFKSSGIENETLRPTVVEVKDRIGREMQIRLVDDFSGPWGHLNFDDFKLHAARPVFSDEFTLAEAHRNEPPPADSVLFAGLSPEAAAKAATLPAKFSLKLFAGEPDIKQPIAFCDDDRGRLWVVEGYTYPKRVGHPPKNGSEEDRQKDIFAGKDRILVFEDTDGDGKFDRRTVFMEGLNLASGIEYGFGGIFVGAAPYLMFIPIQDGDVPKPAGPPQVLLDGWNYSVDTHEVLNTFSWGPDGWLYGCHGVFCPSNVGKPGAPESERQWMDAGVWRYHPIRRRFEVFAEGTSNPWGVDFDENGQCWIEACVIPHLYHMIQGGRYFRQGGDHFAVGAAETLRNAKHRDMRSRKPVFPYVYEDITTVADHLHYAGNQGPHAANGRSDAVGGGHAHAGMMVYLGASWPADYRGNLILGNIHGQRLNTDLPIASGSGYIGKHGPDFLNFNDTWSQTLNQRYDADGSVYVIDWYDKNQCHHNREDGHDRSNGRIYKIVYDNQATTPVNLAAKSDDELVRLVTSKNEWMSRHARRLLQERIAAAAARETVDDVPAGLEDVVRQHQAGEKMAGRQALRDLVDSGTDSPARLRALWALHLTGGLGVENATRWAKDRDPWVRAWTIQLFFENAELLFSHERLSELADGSVASLADLAQNDPSPVVRRFVASAAQRVPVERRWSILNGLAGHAEDIADHNLPLMYWYASEGAVAADPGRGLDLLRASKIPKLREFIARRIATASMASAK